jgi:tetratricopeptide (TPR) repeat protein
MKKEFLCSLVFMFLLGACASPTQDVTNAFSTIPSNLPTTPSASTTSTPAPTVTATLPPTATEIPPTATIDFASLPTRTPQPPAACPQVDPKLKIFLGDVFTDKKAAYHDARQVVLDFLNMGGDPEWAIKKLDENDVKASQRDITYDGVKEFFLPGGYYTIFGCQGGKYVTLLDISPAKYGDMPAVLLLMEDFNRNGVPELLLGQVRDSNGAMYRILEWDGAKLADLAPSKFNKKDTSISIEQQVIYTTGQGKAQKGLLSGNYDAIDTDANGLKDIVIRAGIVKNSTSTNNVEDVIVLKWDGSAYSIGEVVKENTATPTPTLTLTPTYTPLPFSVDCSIKVQELNYLPDSANTEGFAKSIEIFLNAGGLPEKLRSYYSVTIKDLNADSVAEILVKKEGWASDLALFYCKNGKYADAGAFYFDFGATADVMAIVDNNKNGFVEIFFKSIGCFMGRCGYLNVVEWDGERFASKVKDPEFPEYPWVELNDPDEIALKDLDKDSIKELVWTEVPTEGDYWEYYPVRVVTHVLKWDGENYSALPVEYAAPKYRFQAVQDGDWYAQNGLYDKALKSYQLSIQSEGLGWWTEERREYIIGPKGFGKCNNPALATPVYCPPPQPNPDERPVLSAYASFKSVAVYLLTNRPEDAQTAYDKILATYPEGSPAYPITQVAVAFWESYQSNQKLENACQQVVSSLGKNEQILRFLTGGANHSLQGINYTSKSNLIELCPFK